MVLKQSENSFHITTQLESMKEPIEKVFLDFPKEALLYLTVCNIPMLVSEKLKEIER